MNERNIRLGLSGISGIAQVTHLPLLKKLKAVEVTAICDNNISRAKKIADKYEIPNVYSNIETMINESEIDVIDICSAVQHHHSEAIFALENGKHVMIEKPFARNAQEALQIVDTAEKNDRRLMALMNLKFRPDAIALKSILDNKKIGNIFCIKSGWLRRNEKWQQRQLFLKNEQGVIMHLGLQIIDLGLWLLKNPKVKRLNAVGFNHIMKCWVEDTALIVMHLENGTVFSIEIGWNMKSGKDFLYANLIGDKGMARLIPLSLLTEENNRLIHHVPSPSIFKGEPYQKSYENEFAHFIFCLRYNQTMQSKGDEIVDRLKIIDAIYESIKHGTEVVLG